MAFTLVVNPGSSSKKFALYDNETQVFSASFERNGEGIEQCTEVNGTRQRCEAISEVVFTNAVQTFVDLAVTANVLPNVQSIARIGMRVVAPGTYFTEHRLVDEEYIARLQDRSPLAPLHTPMLLREIAATQAALPNIPIIGVSDSAFHATKPPEARDYSISKEDEERYDIHRYGYHGLSVASVARRLEQVFGEVPRRTIVCHVGSGVSVTALRDGVSVETSMGYSPESGLMMGTRSGDVDAGALLALMHEKRMMPFDAHVYLSTRGGLKGMLGNADLRYALERSAHGDAAAKKALSYFSYQIKKRVGAHFAVLGGLDAIVLTATAVFRNPDVRTLILSDLEALGVRLAVQRNQDLVGAEGFIHANGTAVKVAVMRTDEMGEVAKIAARGL